MVSGWEAFQQSAQNDLFSTQEQRDSEKLGKLQEMYLSELIPFKNHTFKVRDDNKMHELIESIEQNGIIQPAIVFYNEESQVELVSGHRRYRAAELLGLETLPVLIKQMTRDEAIIVMGETNLQSREEILPSEKAFTYKQMLDAIHRVLGRPTQNASPVETHFKGRSDDELSKKVKESRAQIQRYIRLTNLMPELLELVDIKRIGLRPAVELSYLPMNLQECIYGIYEEFEITPSLAQAIKIKKLYQQSLLDESAINDILMEVKPNQKESFKISEEIMNRFFDRCKTKAEVENRIIKALELLEKQERIKGKSYENNQEITRG